MCLMDHSFDTHQKRSKRAGLIKLKLPFNKIQLRISDSSHTVVQGFACKLTPCLPEGAALHVMQRYPKSATELQPVS